MVANMASIVELARQPALPMSQGCGTSFRDSSGEVRAEEGMQ